MDVRILAVSDLHGDVERARKLGFVIREVAPDLVLVGGDLTNFGTLDSAKNILGMLVVNDSKILFVPGNCDPRELLNVEEVEGAHNIHGRRFEFKGVNVLGIGGSNPTPFKTLIEFSEEEIRGILSSLDASPKSIVLSHFPPHNTRLDRVFFGVHVGSVELRKFIERHKPRLVVVGHVHEGRGQQEINTSIIVNGGPGARGFYSIVDWSLEAVEVTLNQI
ncbi:MAG: metallophosphoesterase [Candidatus Geothermarchaeales archaeon]